MMSREEAWKRFVEDYPLEVPEEMVENELQYILLDLRHRMQYDRLVNGTPHVHARAELDGQREELLAAAYGEAKSELVMKEMLKRLDFPVSREELESAALELAKREHTTLELIRSFFGADLAMLARDVRQRKVMDWVWGQAASPAESPLCQAQK